MKPNNDPKRPADTPSTPLQTRITTSYYIKPGPKKEGQEAKPPRAALELKTFDPVSGATLKYRTTKAAEVSRLIQTSLGKLGRGMANVPEPAGEAGMTDAPPGEDAAPATTTGGQAGGQTTGGAGGGGGGKKKKKGKK